MAYVIPDPNNPPAVEPVTLAQLKDWTRWPQADVSQDNTFNLLIKAAREVTEGWCRRSWVQKGYIQFLDSPPYFTDTIMSQMAYPPSYYSLPRYSTTLWNYSQMIKLFYGPLVSVASIEYVSSVTNVFETLLGTTDVSNPTGADFLIDVASEPPRIFPAAGMFWPPVKYVPNSWKITYQSGFSADASRVPASVQALILALAAHWFAHPEMTGSDKLEEGPVGIEALIWANRVLDLAPTRG